MTPSVSAIRPPNAASGREAADDLWRKGVDPVGEHATFDEAADEPGDAEFFVAEHVGDDVTNRPLSAQRRRVPLARVERADEVGKLGPFVMGEAHSIRPTHPESERKM
jgi:hypothetical protein